MASSIDSWCFVRSAEEKPAQATGLGKSQSRGNFREANVRLFEQKARLGQPTIIDELRVGDIRYVQPSLQGARTRREGDRDPIDGRIAERQQSLDQCTHGVKPRRRVVRRFPVRVLGSVRRGE